MKKTYITFLLVFCIFFCNSSFVYASDDNSDDDVVIYVNDEVESVLYSLAYSLGYAISDTGGVGSFFGNMIVDYCMVYGQTKMPDDYQTLIDLLENTTDETEKQELIEEFIEDVYFEMQYNGDLLIDVENNTASISEDLASLYQAYLQNNVTPYVVHYSIPIEEVPASIFKNIAMIDYIQSSVIPYEEYNGESTFENRVVMIRPYGNFVEYYDVTGLSFVINSSLTMEDYNYSLVGTFFDSLYVNSYNSSGVKTGNGKRVLLTYGGSLLLPYINGVYGTNDYWRFYFNYDKSLEVYNFSYFVHASGEPKPILFFRDTTALMEYMSGQSSCYMIPTDYTGGDLSVDLDMDYDEMYEAIQKAIQNGSFVTPSDLQSIIDSAVKEYQQEMLDQLHDINNSLNNESGYSWLRLIYNYLNERLTTTLSDLNNSIDALNEMFDSMIELLNQILDEVDGVDDVTGSTSSNSVEGLLQNILEEHRITNKIFQDMTEYLDDIIALLCEITDLLHNILDNFQNDYVDLSSNVNVLLDDNKDKFPLSLPHDYYLLFSLFNAEPKTPEYVLNFSVDSLGINQEIILSLSGFEILGRLSRLFFSIIFIFLLIPLTMKIIDFNERLVS